LHDALRDPEEKVAPNMQVPAPGKWQN